MPPELNGGGWIIIIKKFEIIQISLTSKEPAKAPAIIIRICTETPTMVGKI